MDTR
jgi:hypothetical protein